METNDSKMERFETFVTQKIEELNTFIHLNEFNNQEIKKLERKNRFLEKDLKDSKQKNSKLEQKNINLNNLVDSLESEIDSLRYPKTKKRQRLEIEDPDEKWLSKYKRKKTKKI